ncbi:hypothetical protein Dvina_31985 [Dactylosporangium vinaceum]|uniref:Uncharacterized protein n=1 Tax=Dactylosporangium vinaceum TaxID=53362 RepID=A0ABV5MAP4_9ACTN|nr:hypothetical protein [Dactylosporangium vinaceum]UAB92916.1 hypothetical protein Dvina_31985 [Dactylosporangium vinaceum]
MSDDQALIDTLPRTTLSADELRRFWAEATGLDPALDPDAWEACEDAVLGTLDPNRGLQMRPGGWTVDLSGTVARFAVASALIAGVMWHEGLDQLPGFLFPQVLPLLFDVRRARLTKQDERLLLQLRMHTTTEQLAYPWPAEALYARLPDDLRGKVSPVDFEDFVTRLVQVGEADDAGLDEVRIRPAGRARWLRISIRH